MARRLTPDPLQVDPWTKPMRISFPLERLFYLGFYAQNYTTKSVSNVDIKGQSTCPLSDAETKLPCGDDVVLSSVTEVSLRHLARGKVGAFDALIPEMGFFNLINGEFERDTLGMDTIYTSNDDFFDGDGWLTASWSRIFEETSRASVESDPTAYGQQVDVATFGQGSWSGAPQSLDVPLYFDVKIDSPIIGTVGGVELREPGAAQKQWGFTGKICGELFCAARLLNFPRWSWPIEIGAFQQTPLSPPQLDGMKLKIDGVTYNLVALSANPRNEDYRLYYAFFQREDATRTLSEILS